MNPIVHFSWLWGSTWYPIRMFAASSLHGLFFRKRWLPQRNCAKLQAWKTAQIYIQLPTALQQPVRRALNGSKGRTGSWDMRDVMLEECVQVHPGPSKRLAPASPKRFQMAAPMTQANSSQTPIEARWGFTLIRNPIMAETDGIGIKQTIHNSPLWIP